MTAPFQTRSLIAAGIHTACHAARWWFAELRGLLPRNWSERERARIDVRVDQGDVNICLVEGRNAIQQGSLTESSIEPIAFASALARRRELPVWLFPPTGAVLSRSVQIPRSVVSRFQQLVATEVDRWTSFPSEDIYLTWRFLDCGTPNSAAVSLYFMPRTIIEPTVQRLQSHKLEPSILVLGEQENIRLSLNGPCKRARRRAQLRSMAAAIAAAAMFMAIDWLSAVHQRDALHQEVAFERKNLSEQSNIETRIASILGASSDASGRSARARGEFLAALSSVLPSTDWLTDISIRGSDATLRGYALSPEALIKVLEPLSKERTVMLQGAVSMDKRLERSQFAVVLRLPHSTHEH